jgi:hypothetical protein
MAQARPTRKLLDWKPMGTSPVGRPRLMARGCHGRFKKTENKKLEGNS